MVQDIEAEASEASRRLWLQRAAVMLVPVLLYLPSLKYGLLDLDDELYYLKNPALHGGAAGGLIDLWHGTFLSDYSPVSNLTLWLDLALFGDHAWWGARLHGLIWFALGSLAVHETILRISARPRIALAVALLYALHPACAPSALWLAERKHLVCLAFSFFALCAYIAARENRSRRAGMVAVVLTTLALLSKPHATALPLMLTAWELSRGSGPWKRRVLCLLPFFLLAGTFTVLTLVYARQDLERSFLGGSRLAAVASDGPILMRYLQNFVCPAWPAFYYHVDEYGAAAPAAWFAWLGLIALSVLSVALARERRLVLCGWALGIAAIAPALNLVPQLAPMADHYLQWALPGLLLALIATLDGILERWNPPPRLRWIAGGAAGVVLGILSFRRIDEFSSLRAVFETAVVNQPTSSLNWAGYAQELAGSSVEEDHQLAGVAALRALQCDDAHRLLAQQRSLAIREGALLLYRQGHPDKAWSLAQDETQKFSDSDGIFARLTLAEVGARTDHSAEAIDLMEPILTPDLRTAMASLREKTRDGRQLPNDIAPLLALSGTGRDAFAQDWGEALLLRSLQVLGLAYLKHNDAEKAFDVAALMVNARPDFAGGRAILAAAWKTLGVNDAAARLQASETVSPNRR